MKILTGFKRGYSEVKVYIKCVDKDGFEYPEVKRISFEEFKSYPKVGEELIIED